MADPKKKTEPEKPKEVTAANYLPPDEPQVGTPAHSHAILNSPGSTVAQITPGWKPATVNVATAGAPGVPGPPGLVSLATTVTDERSYGAVPVVGVDAAAARGGHSHGSVGHDAHVNITGVTRDQHHNETHLHPLTVGYSLDGEEGQEGPPGRDGRQGVDGAQGPPGADGAPGGPPGPTGFNGPTGMDGIDGQDGIDGFPGIPGRQIQIYEQVNEPLSALPGDFWITP